MEGDFTLRHSTTRMKGTIFDGVGWESMGIGRKDNRADVANVPQDDYCGRMSLGNPLLELELSFSKRYMYMWSRAKSDLVG